MRRLNLALLFLLAANYAVAENVALVLDTKGVHSLPEPVTNNATTRVNVGGHQYVVSFNGLGESRTHNDTLAVTYVLDAASGQWSESQPVPGGVGRLASAAVSVGKLAYVVGGYTVAANGEEVSTPWLHSFDPVTGNFEELTPMPVPVDDTVAVTYADRFIYLVSGWHDLGNVNLVQRYDTEVDDWQQATPIPGRALFGHAGGVVDNKIVYCDGVAVQPYVDRRRDYVASDECFLGIIDAQNSRRIDWRKVDRHPGAPRYRMAAVGVASLNSVLFIGGSENPYNYNGIGYNGDPSEPAANGLMFDLRTLTWQVLPQNSPSTMDHRGLVVLGGAGRPLSNCRRHVRRSAGDPEGIRVPDQVGCGPAALTS